MLQKIEKIDWVEVTRFFLIANLINFFLKFYLYGTGFSNKFFCFPYVVDCNLFLKQLDSLFYNPFFKLMFVLFVSVILLYYFAYLLFKFSSFKVLSVSENTVSYIHIAIFVPFFFVYFFLGNTSQTFAHPEVYIFWFNLIFLVSVRSKIASLYVLYVATYFCAGISKIDNLTWSFGLIEIPFVSTVFVPMITNFMIFAQITSPLVFLTSNRKLKVATLSVMLFFHLLTYFVIGFRFIYVTVPFIIIFYFCLSKLENVSLNIFAKIVILLFVFLNMLRILIPGNDYFTWEGSIYGLNMFQNMGRCEIKVVANNFQTEEYKTHKACSYFHLLNKYQKACLQSAPISLSVEFREDIFNYKSVNIQDICQEKLTYLSPNNLASEKVEFLTENMNFVQKFFYNNLQIFSFVHWFFWYVSFFVLLGAVFGIIARNESNTNNK